MPLVKIKSLIRRAWDIPAIKITIRAVDRMMAREVMLFAGGAGFSDFWRLCLPYWWRRPYMACGFQLMTPSIRSRDLK
jgi:hypothetical protein